MEIIDLIGAIDSDFRWGTVARRRRQRRHVSFESPAPIQRWSGHSLGLDLLTPEMGAFFGRLMIPIDFEPGAEARILAAPPLVLYAAFLQDVHAREHRSREFREADRNLSTFVEHEVHRLQSTDPDAWQDGEALRAELGLAGPSGKSA
jgi:hypothetical protein